MTTDLALQLRSLRREYGANASASVRSHRSLLFTPTEAALTSIDEYFYIGTNGILGLCKIDGRFHRFINRRIAVAKQRPVSVASAAAADDDNINGDDGEDTSLAPLFDEAHKTADRQVMSRAENEALDQELACFFRLLCGYLLLPPAAKAVEWLLRRFNVGLMNTNALLGCALPYHESNFFARVVQTVKFVEEREHSTSLWAWLEPVGQHGQPLPRGVIIERCLASAPLVAWLCAHVKASVHEGVASRPLLALYTSLLVGMLAARPELPVAEHTVNALLPALLDGLSQSASTEFQFASQMVVAQLCRRAALTKRLTKTLFRQIVDAARTPHSSLALRRASLLSAVALTQHQQPFTMSKRCLRHLLDIDGLFDVLAEPAVGRRFCLEPFNRALLHSAFKRLRFSEALRTVSAAADKLPLSDANVRTLLDDLFARLPAAAPTLTDNHVAVLRSLLSYLDVRHAAALDRAMHDVLPADADRGLIEILSACLANSRHQLLTAADAGGDAALTLLSVALDHSSHAFRVRAVQQIARYPAPLDDWANNALLRRLTDVHPEVVAAALASPHVDSLRPRAAVHNLLADVLQSVREQQVHRRAGGQATAQLVAANGLAALRLLVTAQPRLQLGDGRLCRLLLDCLLCRADTLAYNKACCAVLADAADAAVLPLSAALSAARTASLSAEQVNRQLLRELAALLATDALADTDSHNESNTDTGDLTRALRGLFAGENTPQRVVVACLFGQALAATPCTPLAAHLLDMAVSVLSPRAASWNDAARQLAAIDLAAADAELPGLHAHWPRWLGIESSLAAVEEDAAAQLLKVALFSVLTVLRYLPVDAANSDLLLRKAFLLMTSLPSSVLPLLSAHFATLMTRNFDGDAAALLRFLASFFSDEPQAVPAVCSLRAINIAHTLLRSLAPSPAVLAKHGHSLQAVLLPAALVALQHDDPFVRAGAMSLIGELHQLCKQLSSSSSLLVDVASFQQLLAALVAYRSEFLATPEAALSSFFAARLADDERRAALLQDYVADRLLELDAAGSAHAARVLLALFVLPQPSDSTLERTLPVVERLLQRDGDAGPLQQALFTGLLEQLTLQLVATLRRGNQQLLAAAVDALLRALDASNGLRQAALRYLDAHTASLAALAADDGRRVLTALVDMALQNAAADGSNAADIAAAKQLLTRVDTPPSLLADWIQSLVEALSAPPPAKNAKTAVKQQHAAELSAAGARIGLLLEVLHAKTDLVERYPVLLASGGSGSISTPGGGKRSQPETVELLLPVFFALLELLLLEPASRVVVAFGYHSTEHCAWYTLQVMLGLFRNMGAVVLAAKNAPTTPAKSTPGRSTPGRGAAAARPAHNLEAKYRPRVPVLVRCLQASRSTQLQNALLLLLSEIGRFFPLSLLEHIVPLFSIMGSTALLRDDNHTFSVIQQTVQALVPVLCEHGGDFTRQMVDVFVRAFHAIPNHRRMLFYVILANAMKSERLALLLSTLLRWHLSQERRSNDDDDDDNSSGEGEGILSFVLELCFQFMPVAVAASLRELLDELPTLGDVSTRDYALALFGLVGDYLSAKPVIAKIVAFTPEQDKRMQAQLLRLFTQTLVHIEQVVDPRTADAAVFDGGFLVLEKLTDLLSIATFVEAVTKLLQHASSNVRQRSLVLFNNKITEHSRYHRLDAYETGLLLRFVPQLSAVAATDSEEPANRQVAFMALEILVRNLGVDHPDSFVEHSLPPVVATVQQSSNHLVVGAATVCLASHCAQLGPLVLPFLPRFASGILQRLEHSIDLAPVHDHRASSDDDNNSDDDAAASSAGSTAATASTLFRLTLLSSIEIILQHCANLMSPYLHRLLRCLISPALLHGKQPVVEKLHKILELCARLIPGRLLWPALKITWKAVLAASTGGKKKKSLLKKARSSSSSKNSSDTGLPQESLIALLDFAGLAIAAVPSQEQLYQQHKRIYKLFLRFLSLRASHSAADPGLDADAVEDHAIGALLKLVMKLNENMFKPLFIRTVEWAQADAEHPGKLVDVAELPRAADPNRVLTCFRLVCALSDQLKAIFVPYFGFLLDSCLAFLAAPDYVNASMAAAPTKKLRTAGSQQPSTSSVPLRIVLTVLAALRSCFLHDSVGFITVEKFSRLYAALVPLFDSHADDESYAAIVQALAPCIAQLTLNVRKDSLWKPLNHQLLLKTRARSARTRLAVVGVLRQLYDLVGEAYLVFLPESAPFLSELMEDTDAKVENAVQDLVATIDSLLGDGQSISDYF